MSESKEKILVTGAAGYVGAGLYRDLGLKYETIGTYHSSQLGDRLLKLDTTDVDAVSRLIDKTGATTIIHAASSGSLKWCEEHPEEARKINEDATRNIITAANKAGAGVVLISSFAALNPNNIYAETKANSEKMTRETANKGVIIRPTVVFGVSPNITNDKFMNRIIANIREKTPAVYDNTWQIQPTDLSHLSKVISAIIDKKLNGHTIPVVTEKLATYFDIAQDVLNEFNIKVAPIEGPFYPPEKDDQKTLKDLGLPMITYDEMIQKCITDISKLIKT